MNDNPARAGTARIELAALEGTYRFYVIGHGNDVVLISDDYGSRDRALADIERLRFFSVRLEPCMAPSGRYYFAAVDDSGDRLASSPTYELPAVRDEAQAIASQVLGRALELVLFA
jgi:hypothetical protein